jgi:transcription initiation factor TFIIF subunit beta
MGDDGKYLETARADRSVWLMKCPPVVSRVWNAVSASSSDGGANPNPVVAKVVLSLDLLSSEEREPSLQARPRIPASRRSLSSVLRIWSAQQSRAN